MAGDRWEVVSGGKSKKNKKSAKNDATKEKSKPNPEKNKIVLPGPIQESRTMFDVFVEKKESSPKANSSNNAKSKSPQQKKKKSEKKTDDASKAVPYEEFHSITKDSVTNLLAVVKARFPDAPLIWLKDLASFLNIKLSIPVEDPVFTGQPIGFPRTLLKENVYNLIMETFNSCNPATLQLFFEFCLQSLIQDIIKGLHCFGYRLVLQCLAESMPYIVTVNLNKLIEYRNTYKNRQDICLTILWVAGQAGNNSLETGFKVWNELMFPIISSKICTNYTVDYLEKLLSSPKALNVDKSVLGVRELFPILDFIYSHDLSPALQKRLIPLFPQLKQISYGPQPKNVLRNFFPSYLRRLEHHCPLPLKLEVLDNLVQCLAEDSHSYSVWRQLYVKHHLQSRLLIEKLNGNWENLPPKFPKQLLRDTLLTFQVTNEDLLNQGNSNSDNKICIADINELLQKMDSKKFNWSRFALLAFLIVAAVLTYDIQKHGSFQASITGKFMKDTGILATCEQAWSKIVVYSGKISKWLKTNIPIVTNKFHATFKPYFDTFWKEMLSIFSILWNNTAGFRAWCNTHLESFLLTVDRNFSVYGPKALKYTQDVAVVFVDHVTTVTAYAVTTVFEAMTWLHLNVFRDLDLSALKQYGYNIVESSQKLLVFLYDSACKHTHSLISYFKQ